MTSTADMTQHPDVSEISDLTEGLLSPAQSNDLRQHLDDCALCADVHASLEEIRGMLGTLPGTPRMPADIAERIDAALAAEALLDSTAPERTTHVSRETTHVSSKQETHPATERPSGHARGTTGPGRTRTKRRRRTATLGAVFTIAAISMSVLLLQMVRSTDDGASEKRSTSAGVADLGSADDFAGPALESTVQLLVGGNASARRSVPENSNGVRTHEAPSSPKTLKGAAAPTCVQQGTGRLDSPIAVEQGTYEGENAYLMVFPHSSDTGLVQAYVVDAVCVNSSPPAAGKLLLEETYSRR
ncbi:anti-sigma factor family protein [Streptomyces sp. NPDC059155]|uniref:anti-sigma factor family protein n=2 Tax=unclassified Streptomyces TaxID=2593676 RepID=UPI0036CFB26F